MMRTFEIWIDYQEQWYPNNIDRPSATVEALDLQSALEKFADDIKAYRDTDLIVRESGVYYEVTIRRTWLVTRQRRTTLEELCSP
jgi:HEAT repeat protein